MEQWASGMFQSSDPQETAVANSQALAEIKILVDIASMDYEKFSQLLEGEEDE